MSNQSTLQQKQADITLLASKYQVYNATIDKHILAALNQLADEFKTNATYALEQNRLLRIGIVGQIKRGKSSFLNSLLFNSKEVLPKAATPMTAALTKIRYAEQPSASVAFYTEQEWQKVVQQVQLIEQEEAQYQDDLNQYNATPSRQGRGLRPPHKPQLADEAKACQELLTMVKKSGLVVTDFLGKTQSITDANSNEDLVADLKAYVGAEGQFTPIVKSTELALNIDGLKGIEVVDTPGVNDPIISRGRRTQVFLGQCDVVFLLSYCGQFLDRHDMSLLAQNIPNKGIEDIVLIGSLFDSVLLDECHNYSEIGEALPEIICKLNDLAKRNVDDVCQRELQYKGQQGNLMTTLKNALPPIFVSARCLDLARKKQGLNEEEKHSLFNLDNMFKDFTWTADVLEQVSNFSKVEEKLEAVRAKKEHILEQRFDKLLQGVQREMQQNLEQIKAGVSDKRKRLLDGDLEKQEAQQQHLIERIESGKTRVKAVFEKYQIQAEKVLMQALQAIQQDALQAKQISSLTGARHEEYETSRQVSDSSWYNPFSWGSTRTIYTTHTRTVNYTYANTQDAVNMLEEFVMATSQCLYEASHAAINLELFRADIKRAVKDLFDFADDTVDPESILLTLGNAVERITLPSIKLDLDHHIDTIRQQFSTNEVQGDEINQLRNEQARVVALLLTEISEELEGCIDVILTKLNQEESIFVPSLTKDLNASVEQLKSDLKNSEQALARYEQILLQVTEDILLITA